MINRRTTRAEGERGFVTVMVVFTVILVTAISFSLLEHGLAEVRSVTTFEESLQAFQLAELALSQSEMELLCQKDYDGGGIGTVLGSTPGGGRYAVDLSQVGTDMWVLTAIGRQGHGRRRIEAGLKVTPRYFFSHAIFAKDDLDINSSVQTDSFDSRLGTYVSSMSTLPEPMEVPATQTR